MSRAVKPEVSANLDAISDLAADLRTTAMDAEILQSTLTNLLEEFEYRDRDKVLIDSLYTFSRLTSAAVKKIVELNAAIEALAWTPGGAQ